MVLAFAGDSTITRGFAIHTNPTNELGANGSNEPICAYTFMKVTGLSADQRGSHLRSIGNDLTLEKLVAGIHHRQVTLELSNHPLRYQAGTGRDPRHRRSA